MLLQKRHIQLWPSHLAKEAAEIAQVVLLAFDLLVKLERPAALDLFVAYGPVVRVQLPGSLAL